MITDKTPDQPAIEPKKFAELFRAWRRRCKLTQSEAAYAIRSATGLRTTGRTVWVWEAARALPQRPRRVLDLIHGPLAVNPPRPRQPKPIINRAQFAALLRDWRRTNCLTQKQACAALGLPDDRALISNWEKCKVFPKKPRLEKLVAALKEPPASPGTHRWFEARSHEFGQKLRAWREARGLRQSDACAVLGLPRDQGLICRYERGDASPRRERMMYDCAPRHHHRNGGAAMRIMTKRGYDFGEVSSAMQNAIRRADTRLAGYWALDIGRWSCGRAATATTCGSGC